MKITSTSSSENARLFSEIIGPERNFDIINKKTSIGDRAAEFFMIDGFVKDEIMEKILESFLSLKADEIPDTAEGFSDLIPYIEVTPREDFDTTTNDLLSGMVIMFMDGYVTAYSIDCRTYPTRSVSEPWKNRVLRGSRDGFVETIVSNIALIRRRIRTPELSVEATQAGKMSHTDIAFVYIKGRADEKLLASLKARVEKIKVEALTMNIESLAEVLLKGKLINPFPKFKYSERPDTTAAAIYDGNIAILVDNSPAALIVPTSIFDIVEEADDYYFPPLTGTYIKWSKYIVTFLALILTPLWVLLMNNPHWLPESMKFILVEDGGSTVPILWQLFILEFAIDGLRLAAVNTPSMLSTPLSVIAGIVVGEYAVSSGWFDAEALLYMAVVTIGTYTQSSYELGYAIKFFRLIMLILTSIFGLWGFIAGLVWFILALAFNKTISEKSYIYPIVPFNAKMLKRKLLRVRLGREK